MHARARARACVRVCVCVRARACVCACESNKVGLHFGVFLTKRKKRTFFLNCIDLQIQKTFKRMLFIRTKYNFILRYLIYFNISQFYIKIARSSYDPLKKIKIKHEDIIISFDMNQTGSAAHLH